MGKLRAGSLNRLVTIQRKERVRDNWGQTTDQWSTVARVWANFKTISGSGFVNQEFVAADQEVSRTTASVRIRFRSDVDAGMRLVLDDRVYDIRAVLPDEERREYVDLGVAIGAKEVL